MSLIPLLLPMLLGKRPRLPIKRTTSITGINGDLTNIEPSELQNPIEELQPVTHNRDISSNGFDHPFSNTVNVSTRNYGRNSGYFIETANFLRTCGLCRRRLASGRDIYMYKGDTAFCSVECREQRMKQDERKEKCATASKNENHRSTATVGASPSCKSETVAAA